MSSAPLDGTAPATADEQLCARGLKEALVEARAAWPSLRVDGDAFEQFVAEKAGSTGSSVLRVEDLYLAFACMQHDAVALRILDRDYLTPLGPVLMRLGLSDAEIDEVRQRLRQRLLIGTARSAVGKLHSYAGRGKLVHWVRTAAIRTAQNMLEERAREIPCDSQRLDALLDPEDDPQLRHLKQEYRQVFRRAFSDAAAALTARQRNLLRFFHVDGMTIDALAVMYGVHRATAARWVVSARERLIALTQQIMMEALELRDCDLRSVLRLIESQLDASVRRCLGTSGCASSSS